MVRVHSYGDNVSFYHLDEHARKITSVDISSIDDIVHYLKRGVDEENLDRDLYLARGFLVWLSLAYEDRSRFKFERFEQLIEYPVNFYELFCRSAGIECKIIKGKAKAKDYKVGDKSVDETHYWLALKVQNQWHLIDPGWCLIGIEGHSHGGEILLERDGRTAMEESTRKEGHELQLFDEFTFCTNPDIFLYSHFPDEPEWQLLQDSRTPTTFDEWVNLPYIKQRFFDLNLVLLSEESCKLTASNGRCTIQIMAEESTIKDLKSSNQLYLAKEDMPADLDPDDLPLLVFTGRDASIFIFELRFPVVGSYRFVLYFGQASEKLNCCCQFSIRCDTADPNCRKLPVNPSNGFGYSREAEEAGLFQPSVSGPKIFVKSSEYTNGSEEMVPKVNFRVDKDALEREEYGSFLCSGGQSTYYKPKLDEMCRLIDITPEIPMDGFRPLLYYIVTSEDDTEYKRGIDVAKKRKMKLRMEEKKGRKMNINTHLKKRKDELTATICKYKTHESDKSKNECPYEELLPQSRDDNDDNELLERLSFDNPFDKDGGEDNVSSSGFNAEEENQTSIIVDGDDIFDAEVPNNENNRFAILNNAEGTDAPHQLPSEHIKDSDEANNSYLPYGNDWLGSELYSESTADSFDKDYMSRNITEGQSVNNTGTKCKANEPTLKTWSENGQSFMQSHEEKASDSIETRPSLISKASIDLSEETDQHVSPAESPTSSPYPYAHYPDVSNQGKKRLTNTVSTEDDCHDDSTEEASKNTFLKTHTGHIKKEISENELIATNKNVDNTSGKRNTKPKKNKQENEPEKTSKICILI